MTNSEGKTQETQEGIPNEKKYTDFSRPVTPEKVKRDIEGNRAAVKQLKKEIAERKKAKTNPNP